MQMYIVIVKDVVNVLTLARPVQQRRVLTGAFLSYFFDAMGMSFLALSLPEILTELGISKAQGGLLNSAMLLGMGVSSMLVGRISDKYGRKKALLFSLALFIVFAGSIFFVRSWVVFFCFNFCSGLGLGGIWSCSAALVNETWPAGERGKASSIVMSAGQLGMMFSTILAHFFLRATGWRYLYLTAFAALLAVIYLLCYVDESPVWLQSRQQGGVKSTGAASFGALFRPGLRTYTLAATAMSAFAFIATWGINTWLPTYLVKERGLDDYRKTFFLLVCYGCQFVGQQVFGRVSDRIGRKRTISLLLTAAALILACFALTKNYYLSLVLGGLVYFANAFAGLAGAYFPELFPTEVRGTGAGFCFNVGRGISAISPYVMGGLATRYNLQVSLLVCAAFFLLAPQFLRVLPAGGRTDE